MSSIKKILRFLTICLFVSSCIHCSSDSNGNDNNHDVDYLADTPWPMVSHDVRHTGRSPCLGPQTAVIKWTATCKEHFTGSAAIDLEGNIIVGTYNEGLFCYSPDGELLWTFLDASFIRGTPAIGADGTIYVPESFRHYLLALNPDGTFKWGLGAGFPLRSSPAIGPGGTIYMAGMDCLYAVNPDGTIKWEYCINSSFPGSPAIDGSGNIIIGAMDHYLYAIKPDGGLLWKYQAESGIVSSVSIADDGTIYCFDKQNFFHAISPNGGYVWKKYLGGGIAECSPAIGHDGTVYISNAQELFAYNPDGSIKWQNDSLGYQRIAPTIGNDGAIYIHGFGYSNDSVKSLHAINPEDGSRRWAIFLDIDASTSPVIDANGTIYVGSVKNFYAIQEEQTSTPVLNPLGYLVISIGLSSFLYLSYRKKGKK